MTNPPPEFSGPFTLEIGLDWFFDRFTRGVHGFATTSREFGLYFQTKDPSETYAHVDYPEGAPSLAYIYPKAIWVESVRRWDEQKRTSELERQARFTREAAANELVKRYAQREEQINYFLNILYTRFSSFASRNTKKMLRIAIINFLQGGGDGAARLKLGIDQDTIDNFRSLPQPAPTEEEELLGLVIEKPSTEVKVV